MATAEKSLLTVGGNMRRDLTPEQIRALPEDLHECAWGTWRPAEGSGNPAKDATHGPVVDESGQRGQVWETAEQSGLKVLIAYHPNGLRAWALLDEDGDCINSKGTHRETEAGFVLAGQLIQDELIWRRVQAPDRRTS